MSESGDGGPSPVDAANLARASSTAMHDNDRAAHALGIEIVDVGPGGAVLRMRVREDMLNGHDICHGGMIFTLADTAFAHACNSYNEVTVAQMCTVTYLAPARRDDVLLAAAQERHRYGRNGIYDITVTNQAGADIAAFRGHSRMLGGAIATREQIATAARGGRDAASGEGKRGARE